MDANIWEGVIKNMRERIEAQDEHEPMTNAYVATPPPDDFLGLEAEVQRLRDRVERLEHQLEYQQGRANFLEAETYQLRHQLRIALSQRSVQSYSPDWVKAHLRFLLKACHPDMHSNSPEATKVTMELLKLR